MFFGLLTLLIALTISAVAIYYSVAGLVAIFAAAAVPIIIMGGALEIGKLVTAVWLHRYWGRARWWMRLYLSTAVLVLMFITSMGIFGFLSKAHIEQTAAANEQAAQIERMDDEIARQRELIARAEQRIVKAEQDADKEDVGIQSKIDREQDRIDTAYTRRQPSIEEQQGIISAQETALLGRIAVYEDEIRSLDAELERLNGLAEQYRTELANTNVASVEEQVQPYLDQIAQLDADIARLDAQAAGYEARIAKLQPDYSAVDTLKTQIAAIEESIVVTTNKLQSRERDKIREGQAVIGVTSDGLFGGNTRRALEAWVTAQQDRIASLQAQETDLRAQAQSVIAQERDRLTGLVKSLRGDQTEAVQDRKQGLLDTIDRIRTDAASSLQSQRDNIQSKIDTVLDTDIPANRQARGVAQDTITELRNADNAIIVAAREEIARLRELAEAEIAQAQAVIERLRAEIQIGEDADLDATVDEQNARIKAANDEIDAIVERKFALQAEARKLEAEVGPVKYLAEFIYEDADKNTLEEAVRWVILIIIFVFDPLAVALLIAAQYIFEWRRADRTPPAPKPVVAKWDEAEVETDEEPVEDFDEPEVEVFEEPEPENTQDYSKFKEDKSTDELFKEETVDKEPYDPYTDSRNDKELSADELQARKDIWPDGYTGKLAPPKPFTEDK